MSIIVTGASGALGQEVCTVLLENRLEVAPIRGVDLADADQAQKAIGEIAASSGPIQGLVNVAGGFAWETVMDGDISTWDRMWAMNVRTALNACRSTIPFFEAGHGSIVNIGSAAATRAEFGKGAYAAAKSGVARLTESLAEALKSRAIRVNAVLPSIIDTPANRKDMPDADFHSWVTTRELANVIAFLLSDKASGITGALVPVSGRV
ncbi:MAG: SDR family oxidoreductase [Woeseiaceae bacterium]|nr:SDR family oxidoreductase [Woeseiaceae bacterium]MDX2608294.1 SDR family oxidoreductase [Woeseiaceae bacterium]